MDDQQIVTLRQAAKTIGVAASTLSALLKVEPTLQAAVVGRGARNSLEINMAQLTAAWAALQGEPDQEPPNDRQRYRQERVRHLWFQVAGERARLAEMEATLVPAADLEARRPLVMAAVRDAVLAWVDAAAAIAPGLATGEAQLRLQELTHAALVRLVGEHLRDVGKGPTEPVVSLAFPVHAPPSLWALRGDLEAVRAEARRVALLVQRGELVEAAAAEAGLFDEARRLRDGWMRVSETLGLRSRLLRDPEAFRAAAIQELSRVGLVA